MLAKEIEDFLNNNQWNEAIQLIKTIPLPLSDEETAALAWCYSRNAEYENAIKLYDDMIQRQPQKAKWHYGKGYQFYMQKDWENAIENFSTALSLLENYLVVKYRIAYAYLQLSGNKMQWSKDTFWKAIRHLEDCHKIFSSYTPDEQKKHVATYADICALHGKTVMASERYLDKSIELLKKANDLKADDDFKYQLAKAFYLKKQYDDALEALPKSNKHYYVPELHSQILSDSGKYQESNEILLKLIKYRKKDYLFRRIAENYLKLHVIDKSESYSHKAVSINKRNYKNHLTLGIVLKEKEMYKSSIQALENARLAKQNQYNLDCSEAIVLIDEINSLTDNNPTDNVDVIDTVDNCSEGKVVKYNRERGFGFILDLHTNNNLFFHISNYPFNEARIGQKVKYEIANSPKGQNAINIKVI